MITCIEVLATEDFLDHALLDTPPFLLLSPLGHEVMLLTQQIQKIYQQIMSILLLVTSESR